VDDSQWFPPDALRETTVLGHGGDHDQRVNLGVLGVALELPQQRVRRTTHLDFDPNSIGEDVDSVPGSELNLSVRWPASGVERGRDPSLETGLVSVLVPVAEDDLADGPQLGGHIGVGFLEALRVGN
jgi:hypothetical protein